MAEPITISGIAALPRIAPDFLQEGDLFLCSGLDTLSRLIQDATDSPISHIGMVSFDQRAGANQVLEAFAPRVRAVPVDWYLSNHNGSGKPYPGSIFIARYSGLMPAQAAGAVKFMLGQLGVGYGFWTIADILIHMKDRMLPPITADGKTWICSQIFQSAFDSVGAAIPMDPNGFCDPGDCASPPQVSYVGTLLVNQ